MTTTSRGTQSFDLPSHLRKSTSVNRARKDNYTTLRSNTSREISQLKQNLEFAELQLKEVRKQLSDEISTNEKIKNILEDNYNALANEKEDLIKQINDLW